MASLQNCPPMPLLYPVGTVLVTGPTRGLFNFYQVVTKNNKVQRLRVSRSIHGYAITTTPVKGVFADDKVIHTRWNNAKKHRTLQQVGMQSVKVYNENTKYVHIQDDFCDN
jgi:hypothetical protein